MTDDVKLPSVSRVRMVWQTMWNSRQLVAVCVWWRWWAWRPFWVSPDWTNRWFNEACEHLMARASSNAWNRECRSSSGRFISTDVGRVDEQIMRIIRVVFTDVCLLICIWQSSVFAYVFRESSVRKRGRINQWWVYFRVLLFYFTVLFDLESFRLLGWVMLDLYKLYCSNCSDVSGLSDFSGLSDLSYMSYFNAGLSGGVFIWFINDYKTMKITTRKPPYFQWIRAFWLMDLSISSSHKTLDDNICHKLCKSMA